jgi:hypothetical protein
MMQVSAPRDSLLPLRSLQSQPVHLVSQCQPFAVRGVTCATGAIDINGQYVQAGRVCVDKDEDWAPFEPLQVSTIFQYIGTGSISLRKVQCNQTQELEGGEVGVALSLTVVNSDQSRYNEGRLWTDSDNHPSTQDVVFAEGRRRQGLEYCLLLP